MQMGSPETGQAGQQIKVYDPPTSFDVEGSTAGLRLLRDPENGYSETLKSGSERPCSQGA